MAAVTIRWERRAAGRDVGDVETVEDTVFVRGCITNGNVSVLKDYVPPASTPAPVYPEPAVEAPKSKVSPEVSSKSEAEPAMAEAE